jgi:hypothetical protein
MLLLFAKLAFGQTTSTPVGIAYPQVAVGGDSGGQNYVTLIQMANNNSTTITGHITLFSDTGSPLSVLFDGDGPKSSLDVTLQGGEARQIQLSLNGALTAGWMYIEYSPSDALTSVILQFRSGTTLLSEVGVDASTDVFSSTDFATETDATLNTGIAIANPNNGTGYVLARLWDASTGNVASSTVLTLPAGGHVAKFLTDLFSSVPNISQIRAKVSLDACASSACNIRGGNGFVATAIRLNGDQFTTIPLLDLQDPATTLQTRSLPQVAFGGPSAALNMKTVLYFTTNVTTGVFGTADIFDNDGNPLKASVNGEAPASSFTFTVNGNRVSRIVLSGDETLRSGWIRLSLPGTVHLITSAIFQTFVGSNLTSEASVLESKPAKRGLIYVKTRAGTSNIGLAFANSNSDTNNLNLILFDHSGNIMASRSVTLPPNGHVAKFVTDLFPQIASTPDFDGALSVTSQTEFSALALRLSFDKIATLPVSANGMFRPTIRAVRVTGSTRSPAQVNFEIDFTDFDADVSTSSTQASADVYVDFGTIYDFGTITLDGNAALNQQQGTVKGSFQPKVTGITSGTPAVLYIELFDSAGNGSNFVSFPFKF